MSAMKNWLVTIEAPDYEAGKPASAPIGGIHVKAPTRRAAVELVREYLGRTKLVAWARPT